MTIKMMGQKTDQTNSWHPIIIICFSTALRSKNEAPL